MLGILEVDTHARYVVVMASNSHQVMLQTAQLTQHAMEQLTHLMLDTQSVCDWHPVFF